jgi:hypothetical protein
MSDFKPGSSWYVYVINYKGVFDFYRCPKAVTIKSIIQQRVSLLLATQFPFDKSEGRMKKIALPRCFTSWAHVLLWTRPRRCT